MILTATAKNEVIELIQGPAGQLEVAVSAPLDASRSALGIVCHPHPLFGGTMNNKVVTTLVKTFQHLGLYSARFNFRGVGRSAGQFDHGVGELEDLLAVVGWLQQQHPGREIWLAGFSFGAYVAAKAATQLPVNQLITVAPAVEHFPMQTLPPIRCPWVVVQGEKDDVVPPEAVFDWVASRAPEPTLLRFPEAGHFFHGQLGELRMRLEEVLRRTS